MYPFHSLVVGFLAATFGAQALVAARASSVTTRSTDVTCGGRFPKAGDGYVERPDGCVASSNLPDDMPDTFGRANFRGVCENLDRCYYTINSNVDYCHSNFCSGLKTACHNSYCSSGPFGSGCLPEYADCTANAETYCRAMEQSAAGIFPQYAKAHLLQKEYNACISEHGGIGPSSTCGSHAEGTTWKQRTPGTHCFWDVYACRNGQVVRIGGWSQLDCIEP